MSTIQARLDTSGSEWANYEIIAFGTVTEEKPAGPHALAITTHSGAQTWAKLHRLTFRRKGTAITAILDLKPTGPELALHGLEQAREEDALTVWRKFLHWLHRSESLHIHLTLGQPKGRTRPRTEEVQEAVAMHDAGMSRIEIATRLWPEETAKMDGPQRWAMLKRVDRLLKSGRQVETE